MDDVAETHEALPSSTERTLHQLERPLTTAQLLWWERIELRENRSPTLEELEDPKRSEAEFRKTAESEKLSALCLSGGGIRSAAFSLGVVQALASRGLLTGFDYLSTVSGGGYLGAFLQRWILGNPHDGRDEAHVEAELAKSLHKETPPQISQLREGSNFLTPRIGLMSSDTWTAIATSLRNISVNWTLFVPLFLIVAAAPGLVFWLFKSAGVIEAVAAAGVLWLALTWAMVGVGFALPTYRSEKCWQPWQVRNHIVIPLVIATLAALAVASNAIIANSARNKAVSAFSKMALGLTTAELLQFACVLAFVVAPVLAFMITSLVDRTTWRSRARDLPLWMVCGMVAGGLLYGGTRAAMGLPLFEWIVVLGPLAFLSGLLAAGWVFSVCRSQLWGNATLLERIALRPDLDREWLVRISAILLKISILWGIFALICLILPVLGYDPATKRYALSTDTVNGISLSQAGIAMAGLVSGVIGALTGKSGSTLFGKVQKFLSLNLIAGVATFFFALFALWSAALVDTLLAQSAGQYCVATGCWLVRRHWEVFTAYAALVALLILFLRVWGRVVDANRFSLNGFYRNRLSRAFLGAARVQAVPAGGGAADVRKPDPFTGLDPKDNVRLHTLWPQRAEGKRASLFPVINVALNAVATKRLSWQERRALPFVMTPLACGSGWLGRDGATTLGAYVPAQLFGGTEPDQALDGAGVTLAAATAISGAAATPNMGYHSSPGTAFLMTLFNVRLGAWLPNPGVWKPREDRNAADKPTNAVMPLLRELGGLTDEDTPDVYLSDGGHFENLGLYEMLRRRCAMIMVVDAASDPDCKFGDLGNAARKAAIDLNVELEFHDIRIASRKALKPASLAYAVADIIYPEGWRGKLVYLKPSLVGELPVDILAYRSDSDSFPHETTIDQWFGESQFESYRHLGADLCSGIPGGSYAPDARERLRNFFSEVKQPEIPASSA
jgi:hypothetical protein